MATFLAAVAPAFTFSGIFTPMASQDVIGRFVARLIPATYFMDVVRATYLKGSVSLSYAANFASLAAYAVVVYTLTWLALQKRMD
jgi:ABC-2 type transport system permease protein